MKNPGITSESQMIRMISQNCESQMTLEDNNKISVVVINYLTTENAVSAISFGGRIKNLDSFPANALKTPLFV